jgi:integrase
LATVEQWRINQRYEWARLGRTPTPEDSIFTTTHATPMLPSVISDAWRSAVARTDLPRMRLHDIRHTHLSHLLRSGEPIPSVSARAGHGTPFLTLTTYAHVLPGDDERTAERAAQMFAESSDGM